MIFLHLCNRLLDLCNNTWWDCIGHHQHFHCVFFFLLATLLFSSSESWKRLISSLTPAWKFEDLFFSARDSEAFKVEALGFVFAQYFREVCLRVEIEWSESSSSCRFQFSCVWREHAELKQSRIQNHTVIHYNHGVLVNGESHRESESSVVGFGQARVGRCVDLCGSRRQMRRTYDDGWMWKIWIKINWKESM